MFESAFSSSASTPVPSSSAAAAASTSGESSAAAASESVLAVLAKAASQNAGEIKEAESQLLEWERQPGFYRQLLAVIGTYSIVTPVRWQAVLYFKNGVDRYWRKMAPNSISDAERSALRAGLLECFSEPEPPIALQLAVLIGKAARFDVPLEWPELVPTLLTQLQSDSELVQHRTLLILHHTIKALSSKRLAADRRAFHSMAEQLLPYVLTIWRTHHANLIECATQQNANTAAVLEKSILAMKVLRKAIIHGLRKPHENNEAILFVSAIFEQTKRTLEFRRELVGLREALEKYSVLHLKVLTDLLETHPFSFITVLRTALEFLCSLCFTSAGDGLLFQRITIFCLNLLKQIILCPEYKPPKHSEEPKDTSTLEAHSIAKLFFSAPTVREICKRLISHYLPLSREDLTLWDADPEDYACEDGGDSWKYSLRPCCETAFLTVFHEFRETLAPDLVALLRANSAPVHTQDLQAILNKDAVYNAVGLAAFDLYDEIDFDQWLMTGLEAELAVKDSNYRIVRRRAVWLLGQWSGVKLSPQLRPRLYQILLPLLQPSEDLVVRLATAKALKVVIDDFEFSSEELEPFLGVAFNQLFNLLKEVQECDTKLGVLNVLSYVIERMGVSIRPFCSELLQYLPALWEASIDHNMLRCSILTTLVFIVQGLGTASESLGSFLYPVIRMSTDVREPCHIYLLEDGLELWLAALHNANKCSQPLFQLANNIPPLLEIGSENLRTVLYIVQSYILLSPIEFIKTAGPHVCAALREQYFDLQDEGILLILRLVELVLKSGPPETPILFKSLVLCSMRAVYDGEDYPMLMSLHLSIIARLWLAHPTEFNQFSVEVANEVRKQQHEVAGRLLDVWLDKMACVTQPERRKLLSLALTSLMASAAPVVVDRIFAILVNVTETLNDITRQDDETGEIIDSLVLSSASVAARAASESDSSSSGAGAAAGAAAAASASLLLLCDDVDYETEHDQRKRQLAAQDSVHTVCLRAFFQAKIRELAGQLGETRYAEMLNNVDVETIANLREYILL